MLPILTDAERDSINDYLSQHGSVLKEGFYDNFYVDTVCCIFKSGHHPDDVIWMGTSDGEYEFDWEQFEVLVKKGYAEELEEPRMHSLTVLFSDDHTLWCEEINGEVYWQWDKGFKIPLEAKTLESLWK